ncbi:hypothetical protein BDQ17DRAFT_1418455 [Cyathus striatus]|nr:hypothetical protein BDQ17DRAFT_1418455 [Cyathus striatus]
MVALMGRSESAEQSPLSQQTIIIIAVCSALGALILAVVLYRSVRSCCRRSSPVPLPPVQPLARQREQQRRTLHADSSFLTPPIRVHPSTSPSKVSLLGKESIPDSRPASIAPTAESAFDDLTPQSPLHPPYSLSPPSSSSSAASHSTSPPVPPVPPLPPVPRPNNPNSLRPSPTSVSSARGTLRSKSTHSAIRGAPHRSAVQIILPAPLAHEVSSYNYAGPDRHSVVDKWIPTSRDHVHRFPDNNPGVTQSTSWTAPSSRTPLPGHAPSISTSQSIPHSLLSHPYAHGLASLSSSSPAIMPPPPSDAELDASTTSRSRDGSPVRRM